MYYVLGVTLIDFYRFHTVLATMATWIKCLIGIECSVLRHLLNSSQSFQQQSKLIYTLPDVNTKIVFKKLFYQYTVKLLQTRRRRNADRKTHWSYYRQKKTNKYNNSMCQPYR